MISSTSCSHEGKWWTPFRSIWIQSRSHSEYSSGTSPTRGAIFESGIRGQWMKTASWIASASSRTLSTCSTMHVAHCTGSTRATGGGPQRTSAYRISPQRSSTSSHSSKDAPPPSSSTPSPPPSLKSPLPLPAVSWLPPGGGGRTPGGRALIRIASHARVTCSAESESGYTLSVASSPMIAEPCTTSRSLISLCAFSIATNSPYRHTAAAPFTSPFCGGACILRNASVCVASMPWIAASSAIARRHSTSESCTARASLSAEKTGRHGAGTGVATPIRSRISRSRSGSRRSPSDGVVAGAGAAAVLSASVLPR